MASSYVLTKPATILNGASLSAAIDLGTAKIARIDMPSAWTAASITFAVSLDGVTYVNLYDAAGVEVTITTAVDRAIYIATDAFKTVRYVKVRSGTAGAAVNQGANRIITLVLID